MAKDTKAENDEKAKALADAEALLRENDKEKERIAAEQKANEDKEKADLEAAKATAQAELDKLEHGDKSKQGRQIKRLQSDMNKILRRLDEIAESGAAARQEEEDPEPALSDMPTADEIRAHSQWTLKQAGKLADKKGKAKSEKDESYGKTYTQLVEDYCDPEEEPELYAFLTDRKDLTFNSRLSDDPDKDFTANLKNATAHLMSKGKGANVRGTDTTVARGANTGTSTVTTTGAFDVEKWRAKISPEEREASKMFSTEELTKMHAEGRL